MVLRSSAFDFFGRQLFVDPCSYLYLLPLVSMKDRLGFLQTMLRLTPFLSLCWSVWKSRKDTIIKRHIFLPLEPKRQPSSQSWVSLIFHSIEITDLSLLPLLLLPSNLVFLSWSSRMVFFGTWNSCKSVAFDGFSNALDLKNLKAVEIHVS